MKRKQLEAAIILLKETVEYQRQILEDTQLIIAAKDDEIVLLKKYANDLLAKYAPQVVALSIDGLKIPVIFNARGTDD